MKPAPFEYHAPESLAQALELLAEHGDAAKPLAGGQSLVPAMSFRLAQPAVLVDLNGLSELDHITASDSGGLRFGAMTRQRTVERHPEVARLAPLVAETMPHIAHPQIRNRGTFGGSLAHADPAAELPAVALALDARFRLRSARREREVAAGDFYTGLFETALEPEELLVEVAVEPPPAHSGWAFSELSRRHGDYALVGVAATVELDEDGRCRQARLALLSVGEGPVLAERAMAALQGEKLDGALPRAAAEIAGCEDIEPPGDIHASAEYRRHLARVLVEEVLERAASRARG